MDGETGCVSPLLSLSPPFPLTLTPFLSLSPLTPLPLTSSPSQGGNTLVPSLYSPHHPALPLALRPFSCPPTGQRQLTFS